MYDTFVLSKFLFALPPPKKVMFSLCWFVCLFECQSVDKTIQKVLNRFSQNFTGQLAGFREPKEPWLTQLWAMAPT